MKLKTKLVLLVFFILAVSMGACAAFSIARLKEYSLSVQVESEREKLRIAGRAFRQVGTREDFENMGEIARDAYLKYQFGRCYQSGYALIKDGVCIANQTDYEIVNLDGLKGEYMVQELGKKHILLLRRALEYPDGFEVLAASMPCVVTVTKPYFDPRFPTIKSKLAAGRAQIPTLTADDLPVDRESIGLKGSPTKVKKSFTPPQKQGGIKISEDSSEASARKLFAMLSDANIIG